ncbi:hypothetical protein JW979_11600 [bacterium]|nr:hypothetical protein [candidate division CSSED10-310 bacterium]
MQILRDIISNLVNDEPVESAAIGTFVTCVTASQAGLASTFRNLCSTDHAGIEDSGKLNHYSLKEIAMRSFSNNLLEASLGMAAVNALIPIPRKNILEMKAQDLLFEKSQNKHAAVIGHFPFTERLHKIAGKLTVIQHPPYQGLQGVHEASSVFPDADVIAITGSSFINHTFQDLLGCANPNAFKIVLGGTTPLSTVLFDHGIDALCGCIINDSEKLLRSVIQGATFRELPGVRKIVWVK